MSNVDNRIVQMQFDNKQFESGIKTSLDSLDNLKKGLNLESSIKSLSNLDKAGKSFSLAGIADGVDFIAQKFSTLGIMGVTAIQNLTNQAINFGKRLVSSFTLDPIMQGFHEYETQINAVQTILANTSSKGTTLQQVNAALAELNTYADKTIYNFTEMTRNIGTFTAAGVELKTSTAAIKGIANLAAVSGSNAQQASTAMYQLSQALSSGTVKLMDWNSVVNAGMGGQVFQDALKETARIHGIKIDEMIKSEGSFRETLQKGWLTSKVLTETLAKFTGDLSAEELKAIGYTKKQIEEIMKLGTMANDAATKVKTVTQLMDTLKEASQSGWTQSWQLLIGDFGEAKEVLTEISNVMGGIIGASADARNKILSGGLATGWKQLLAQGIADEDAYRASITATAKEHGIALDDMIKKEGSFEATLKTGWLTAGMMTESLQKLTNKTKGMSDKQLEQIGYTRAQVNALEKLNESVQNGTVSMEEFAQKMQRPSGRENLIQSLKNGFEALIAILTPVKEAFREIFPPYTAEQLYKLTENIRKFTASLKPSAEQADNLKRTFKGVFAILDIGMQVISALAKSFGNILKSILPVGDGILSFTAIIGDWLVVLDQAVRKSEVFTKVLSVIEYVVSHIAKVIAAGFKVITDWLESFADIDMSGLDKFTGQVKTRFKPFTVIFEGAKIVLDHFIDALQKISPLMSKLAGFLGGVFEGIGDAIANAFTTGNFESLFDLINGGLFATILLGIKKFISSLTSVPEGITGILDSVQGSLKAFQANLNAKTLLKIASAIAILAASLVVMSMIDSKKLTATLAAMTVVFAELFGSMAVFEKVMGASGFDSIGKVTRAMIAMSIAVLILASALKTISEIDTAEIMKGLIAIGALMGMLVGAAAILSQNQGAVIKGATGFVIFATAILILVQAVKQISELNLAELAKGLVGVGVVMAEIVAFMKLTEGSTMGAKSVGILVLAAALNVLAVAVSKFGGMNVETIIKGLSAMTAVLGVLAIFVRTTGNAKNVITTSIGLTVLSSAMLIMAKAIEAMGSLSIEQLIKGLLTMAIALTAITVAVNLMPPTMILSAAALLVISAALVVLAQALKAMGSMSVGEIVKSLIVLGGALTIMAIGVTAMMLALPGAAALLVVAAALAILCPVLKAFGSMSLPEIGKSMLVLAAAFGVLGLAGLILGPVVPILLALGVAVTLLGVGFAAIGVGMLAFATGLSALAVAGVAGAAALVAVLSSILGLIPMACKKLGEGLIAFCKVITDGAPAIGAALKAVILQLIRVFTELAPPLIHALVVFLDKMLAEFAVYIPKMVDSGMKLIMGILRGIADNMQGIVEAGIDIVVNFIKGIITKLPDIIDAAFKLVISFINGLADAIRNNHNAIFDAVGNLITAIGEAVLDAGGKLLEIGGNMVKGLVKGISNSAKAVWDAMKQCVSNVVDGVKDFLGIHSPSVVFAEIGEFCSVGMGDGITKGGKVAATAAQQMAHDVGKAGKETLQKSMAWIDDRKYYNKLSLTDEIKCWEELQSRYKVGTEERMKLDREVYRAKQELLKKQQQDQEEALRKQQQAARDSFDFSVAWIDEEKYYKRLSLMDELAAWERVQARYKAGTEERKKADREVYRVRQELIARQKEIDDEYETRTREVNERLKESIRSVNEEYENAVKSRADSLYNSYGLFDKVEIQEPIDGAELTANLQGQVDQFELWQQQITELAQKGIDEGLVKELQEMGPKSLAQIQALNAMSEEGLTGYVALWRTKYQDAKSQAIVELENMRTESDAKITQLKIDADALLEEYKAIWWTKTSELRNTVVTNFDDLTKDISAKVSSMKTTTDSLFTEITSSIQKIFEDKDWEGIGLNIVLGIAQGVRENASIITIAAQQAALAAYYAARRVLGIKSPSRLFAEVGMYSAMGLAKGLTDNSDMVSDAGDSLGNTAADSLRQALSNVVNNLSGDIDMSPTIRPVLDLSDIQAGSRAIGALMGANRSITVAASVNRAATVAQNSQNGSDSSVKINPGASYSFTQNNYSPKALSRLDIYRQTKNQFSTLKGLVNA